MSISALENIIAAIPSEEETFVQAMNDKERAGIAHSVYQTLIGKQKDLGGSVGADGKNHRRAGNPARPLEQSRSPARSELQRVQSELQSRRQDLVQQPPKATSRTSARRPTTATTSA